MLNSRAGMIDGNAGDAGSIYGRTVIEAGFGRSPHMLVDTCNGFHAVRRPGAVAA